MAERGEMNYIWEAMPHGEVVNIDKKGNKTCACCNTRLPKNWREKDPKLVIKIGNNKIKVAEATAERKCKCGVSSAVPLSLVATDWKCRDCGKTK